ncbi:hypothetical protein HDU83_003453 [Entophlyctis luteolus]|nr:hypothetical protein HDU83_003453 [Entophlyctis luteolus]KAJ3393472.1 hypothetical protein HDU84_001963 [Entophlyctis sp. JEL0112]
MSVEQLKNIWSDMTAVELAHAHPNWENWQPSTGAEPYIISVRSKLSEGGFSDLAKCIVDPAEARLLSQAQGISETEGFWLIPPLKAQSDVKLFSCSSRCPEAGTSILIPEHAVGYPAKQGSIVTVKKGEFYGLGVLNTEIFDQHLKDGKICCCREVTMLRSIKQLTSGSSHAEKSAINLAKATEQVNFPSINQRLFTPKSTLMGLKQKKWKVDAASSSVGSAASRGSVDKSSTLLRNSKKIKQTGA